MCVFLFVFFKYYVAYMKPLYKPEIANKNTGSNKKNTAKTEYRMKDLMLENCL